MLALRQYQIDSIAAVEKALAEGVKKQLVALPTGAGKTICFADLLRKRNQRSLILVHRDELAQQALQKLQMVWPEVQPGIVKAERDEVSAQVVVGSVQTLSREERLARYAAAIARHPLTIITDECQHAPSASYRKIYDALEPQVALHVGFTATPERADNKDLGEVFDKITYQKSLLWMIQHQYLCNIRAKQIKLKDLDLSEVRTRAGDYQEGDLGAALELANAPEHVVAAYLEHAAGRKGLCFTPTVALAEAMAEEFRRQGVAAQSVSGEDPLDRRRAILQMFEEGQYKILTNCNVLTEGFDSPGVSCVMVARPTKSRPFYQQMIGRGTRLHPGKEDCLILDFVGATAEHDLMTLAALLGVTEKTAEGGVDAMLAAAQAAKAVEAPVGPKDGKQEVIDRDIWALHKIHWVEDGPRYLCSLGDEGTLALVPEGLSWVIRQIPRDRLESSRTLYKNLTLGYAQGVAEDLIRKANALGLNKADARWRQDPASAAQEEKLRKWGLWTPGMSKGAASDAMSRFMNRRRG